MSKQSLRDDEQGAVTALPDGVGRLEMEADRELSAEVRDHVGLCREVFNRICEVMESIPNGPSPLARRVAQVLLIRIANDLRVASTLAQFGYVLQAATIVASVFELAFTIGYIGDVERRAVEWVDHEERRKPYRHVKVLVDTVAIERGLTEEIRACELDAYADLCMAKHANPMLQQHYGVRESGDRVEIYVGPERGEPAVRAGWFALANAARLGCVALRYFISSNFDGEVKERLVVRVNECSARWEFLNRRALERWGAKPPASPSDDGVRR